VGRLLGDPLWLFRSQAAQPRGQGFLSYATAAVIAYYLQFDQQLNGFELDIPDGITIDPVTLENPSGFDCTTHDGGGTSDVLRCDGNVQPGAQIQGRFQTNPPMDQGSGALLFGLRSDQRFGPFQVSGP